MRVVADTNTVISGIFWGSDVGQVFNLPYIGSRIYKTNSLNRAKQDWDAGPEGAEDKSQGWSEAAGRAKPLVGIAI